jgi:hypothetical protein
VITHAERQTNRIMNQTSSTARGAMYRKETMGTCCVSNIKPQLAHHAFIESTAEACCQLLHKNVGSDNNACNATHLLHQL